MRILPPHIFPSRIGWETVNASWNKTHPAASNANGRPFPEVIVLHTGMLAATRTDAPIDVIASHRHGI